MSLVGGPQQGGDFLAIATLLADPERLKAEYERLARAKADAEEIVSRVGPAAEVLRLRDEARAALDKANKALEDARIEAKRVVGEASATHAEMLRRGERVLDEAHARAEEMKRAAEEIVAGAKLVEEEAKAALAKVGAERRAVADIKERLADERLRANQAEEKAEQVRLKLQGVAENIAAVLREHR